MRRWFNAAALARPAARGGRVVAVGDPARPALQALVRWDPAGFAARELDERGDAHLPPGSRIAVLTGAEDAVSAAWPSCGCRPAPRCSARCPPGRDRASSGRDRGRRRTSPGPPRRPGAARRAAARCPEPCVRCRACARPGSCPPVRVQVDPYSLG